MARVVIYQPFEDALDRFTWDTRGAERRRPKRIKVGAPELEAFKAWCHQQPGGYGRIPDGGPPVEYAGLAVECVSEASYQPTAE